MLELVNVSFFRAPRNQKINPHTIQEGFEYVEILTGGKLIFDYHASRVLPGFDPNLKIRLLQRLKDKAGNRSNASSEVEFRECLGWLVGEEGAGIKEILSHAHLTRLDFAVGSAGLMRQALTLIIERRRVSQDLLKAHFGSSARATNLLSLLETKGFISTITPK